MNYVSNRVYALFKKNFLAVSYCSIKIFNLQQSQSILDSPWCNKSCRAYYELGQADIYSFE